MRFSVSTRNDLRNEFRPFFFFSNFYHCTSGLIKKLGRSKCEPDIVKAGNNSNQFWCQKRARAMMFVKEETSTWEKRACLGIPQRSSVVQSWVKKPGRFDLSVCDNKENMADFYFCLWQQRKPGRFYLFDWKRENLTDPSRKRIHLKITHNNFFSQNNQKEISNKIDKKPSTLAVRWLRLHAKLWPE